MSTASLFPEHVPTTARQQRELLAGSILDSTDFEQSYTEPLPRKEQKPRFLVVSYYEEIEHQLDLYSVDLPNRLFAQALTKLEPSTPKYAVVRYDETFNWPTVFSTLRTLAAAESFHFPQSEFYVVEFRSKLKKEFDYDRLFRLDKHSHREATAAGGLLKYWFGTPDAERRNLATCLWRSKEDAIQGGIGMWHQQARTIVDTTYDSIDVHGLKLTVDEGAKTWKFEPWVFH